MKRVSGAILIEDNKILLVREEKSYGSTIFMLPGGKEDKNDDDLEATCRREFMEEVGVELEELELFHEMEQIRPFKQDETVLLAHYIGSRVGEIIAGEEVLEWGWYDIDNLPKNVAPNIPIVIEKYKQTRSL